LTEKFSKFFLLKRSLFRDIFVLETNIRVSVGTVAPLCTPIFLLQFNATGNKYTLIMIIGNKKDFRYYRV